MTSTIKIHDEQKRGGAASAPLDPIHLRRAGVSVVIAQGTFDVPDIVHWGLRCATPMSQEWSRRLGRRS